MNLPPILQQLNNPAMQSAKQFVNMIKSAGNPQAMVQSMIARNPQLQQILQQYGNDPQKAFYAYAQQHGIDPNEIINMMK